MKQPEPKIEPLIRDQVRPRPRLGKQDTWMCRLCGDYTVGLRKAHLINVHKADAARMGKRATKGMLFEIFGAPNLS